MNGDPTFILCEAMVLAIGIATLFLPEDRAPFYSRRQNRWAGAVLIVIAVCHGVPDVVHFFAAK